MTDVQKMNAVQAEFADVGHDPDMAATVLATSASAAEFEARQHSLTRMESIRESWKPLAWCLYMFFICITWGYDGLAGGIVVSIYEFRKDFGVPYAGDYAVDANWQLAWLAATLGGMVIGGLATGFAVDRVGRKPCIGAAYLISVGGTFAQFFATNPAHFFAGKLLTGIPMGCFTTVSPTYASEMSPLKIRGAVAAGINFCIVLGQLIGYGVMREASYYKGDLQYKILFAAQWGFCVVGLAVLPFLPDSPYWLVARGKRDQARQTLQKLHDEGYDVDGNLAEIEEALARLGSEEDRGQGWKLMKECFSKKQWKRTLVATSMFFIQNASGNAWVIGYMSYFMQLAGMTPTKAADTSVGLCGLMVVGNMSGWYLVERFGRRSTAFWGNAVLCIALLLIGVLAVIPVSGAIWGQIAFMAIWAFAYQGTLGSVAWPIATENATSRLRSSTQSLATAMNGLSNCIWSFALPYAVNPDQGNMGGKIAFVFGGVLVASGIFIWFFIPETKGRSYIEIDELWDQGVKPWKFEKTEIVTVGAQEKTDDAL